MTIKHLYFIDKLKLSSCFLKHTLPDKYYSYDTTTTTAYTTTASGITTTMTTTSFTVATMK